MTENILQTYYNTHGVRVPYHGYCIACGTTKVSTHDGL